MADNDVESTDVVIIGAGPTGLMLSASLDKLRTKNIVLEKDTEIWPYPRAFRNGETAWRALHNVGLEHEIYTQFALAHANTIKFIPGRHHDYTKPPFLNMSWNRVGFTGHVISNQMRQPVMEKCLQELLRRSEHASLRTGCVVTSINENENDQAVYVSYLDQSGASRTIKAKFLAGADGKVGFTRKKYLEPKGVVMEQTIPYESIWVGINFSLGEFTPQSHPKFPLWKLGYTRKQVVDAFLPEGFLYIANPDRAGIVARIGDPCQPDGLWRVEFELHKSEDRNEMQKEQKIKDFLVPYLTHPGNRYGLKEDVQLPWDCFSIVSTVAYKFAARNCNKWHVGRTMLLGDAAHVFPPYGGQGIRVGMLDATGLAWRLTMASNDPTVDHDHLLTAWTLERKFDVDRALKWTMRNGSYALVSDPIKIFLRDWSIWLKSWIPSLKALIEKPQTSLDKYDYQPGMPFLPHLGGGVSFPQVYCREVGASTNEVRYTDDFIFAREKRSLFQLVQLVDDVEAISDAESNSHSIPTTATSFIAEGEMTTIINDPTVDCRTLIPSAKGLSTIVRIATGEEFLASTLAKGRETVVDYDEHRIAKTCPARYVILRPDYTIYAQCAGWDEAMRIMEGMPDTILGSSGYNPLGW